MCAKVSTTFCPVPFILQFYKSRRGGLLCGKSDFSDGGRACCVLLRGGSGALPAVGIDAFFVIS